MTSLSDPLSDELFRELLSSCRGGAFKCDTPNFKHYATIFNGNVQTRAQAVACPLDAQDVSGIVKFCNKYGLSPSVKAGGYGTAGWAIGGDIIIDLSKINEIAIETPRPDGSFTSLHDASTEANSTVDQDRVSTGKRRRNADAELRNYDQASLAVASLLSGPTLQELGLIGRTPSSDSATSDEQPPKNKRRLELGEVYLDDGSIPVATRTDSTESGISDESSTGASSSGASGTSTTATSPSPPPGPLPPPRLPLPNSSGLSGECKPDSSPFGYLDTPTNVPQPAPVSAVQASYNPHAMLHSWGSGSSGNVDSFELFGQQTSAPAQAEVVHPYAYVTFGAGMRQKEVDQYTAKHKLEARYITGDGDGIPYHVPFSAHPVGSSIMLLAGFGFLSRLHGLSIDNLVEVEMVLADGRIVIVSENEHPDLWWAVRGAGTTLGIATRYKAKAYPIPVVFAGNLVYTFNVATAPSLIKHVRDCVKGASRELYANVLLTAGPQGKDSLVVIQMCYVGPREKGQEYLTAISSWTGQRCVLNEVDEKSFLHQQDSVAQVLRGKPGRQWFIRSTLVSSLPDNLINDTVNEFNSTPVGCTWLFELAGGAIADFTDTVIPKSQREATWTVAALHQWDMDVDDDRCVDAAEEWIADTLKPVHVGGPYPSFLGRHEDPERTKACYGANWDRLVEIKNLYDPDNLFRNTFWPLNTQGKLIDPREHEPPTPEHIGEKFKDHPDRYGFGDSSEDEVGEVALAPARGSARG